jgi:hypothetical protein
MHFADRFIHSMLVFLPDDAVVLDVISYLKVNECINAVNDMKFHALPAQKVHNKGSNRDVTSHMWKENMMCQIL